MDAVYKKADCSWISERICLKDYFSAFSAAIPTASSCKARSPSKNGVDTNRMIIKLMGVSFKCDEMKILKETCRFVYAINDNFFGFLYLECFCIFYLRFEGTGVVNMCVCKYTVYQFVSLPWM